MLCVCIGVIYVCNVMCYVQRVGLILCLGELRFGKAIYYYYYYYDTNKKRLGARAFKNAAPTPWNSLPESVRNAETVGVFLQGLKTHLFKKSNRSLVNSCLG